MRIDGLVNSRVSAAAAAIVVAAVVACSASVLPIGTAAPGPTVPPDRINSIFLTPEEVKSILGAHIGMDISVPISQGPYTKNLETMTDPDCQSTYSPGLGPVYEGSGYTAISTEMMVGVEGRRLTQAVAAFPSADLAGAFVANIAAKWKGCAGRTIRAQTIPTNSGGIYDEQTFILSDYLGGADAVGLTRTRTDGHYPQCQRGLGAESNVVVDVDACTAPLDQQGRTIADKMLAKVGVAAS
jgi:PknH-like protein